MIEFDIHCEIYLDRMRENPQMSNSIFVGKWLHEMPEFACDRQASQ
jgi:hypothetical protein